MKRLFSVIETEKDDRVKIVFPSLRLSPILTPSAEEATPRIRQRTLTSASWARVPGAHFSLNLNGGWPVPLIKHEGDRPRFV